ncbi:MAG TPA: c-type cytochrome [Terriglobales bacterium]|jgi:mono/diheme cytochrome c family protein|nr:c-type cytochrome [Terriglobales bacterium]
MRTRFAALFLGTAVLIVAVAALGQQPKVEKTAAPPTSAGSGQEMFKAYCASCHGADLKGDGPAAPALKTAPSDLTTLAKHNGGTFPTLHVAHIIAGEENYPAHGSKDMPVWGPVFRAVSGHDQSMVTLRVNNLTKYIEEHQAK